MTEVLRISPTLETQFSSGGLRRTTSQSSLFLETKSASRCNGSEDFARRYSSSLSSSAPSSPRLTSHDVSSLPSYSSTPASSLSLRDHFCLEEVEDMQLPSYIDETEDEDSGEDDDDLTPSNSPPQTNSYVSSENSSPGALSRAPSTPKSLGDDLTLETQPSRHVDYLSHEWKEEELWSSWRHVVGKRRTIDNWERLENASWRTWAKSRARLPTVSPEALNWMKDHDVTWLYGPLQSPQVHRLGKGSPATITRLSRTDSFVSRKSILKKRSLSEVMLQRSLSNSNLVRQAVDSIVSQRPSSLRIRPTLGPRTVSEGPKPYATPADTPLRYFYNSSSSSGTDTPSEKRHIHFSEKVEQCIAINKDGDEDHEEDEDLASIQRDSDSESDDGIIMMRSETGKERRLSSSGMGTPRSSFSSDTGQRTIAMLPSTKLRGDTPEPPETPKFENGGWNPRGSMIKSSSQETLKPSRPSSNFLLPDDPAETIERGTSDVETRQESRSGHSTSQAMGSRTIPNEDEEMERKGLRRTPSGMFMPYDDDEEGFAAGGLLGKVIDTVNTVRDIAHVVWNVGYRR